MNKRKKALKIYVIYKIYGKSGAYIFIINRSLSQLGLNLRIVPKLLFFDLIKNQVNFVHLHFPEELYKNSVLPSLMAVFILLKIFILKIFGIKFAWTVHDLMPHDINTIPFLDLAFRKILMKLMNILFIHNNYTYENLLQLGVGQGKMTLIKHPNYLSYYPSRVSKLEARKKMNLNTNSKIFLFFGRIRPHKHFDKLIDCFKILPRNNILLIAGLPAGSDWDFDKNRRVIEKKICNHSNIKSFLRWIEDDELHLFFNAADYVILPFKRITTSGSLILAQSFAKPIIAPNIDSISEYLNNKAGVLYNPSHKDSLLTAIKKIQNRDLKKMEKEAFRLIQDCNPIDVARGIKSSYIKVLNNFGN